MANCFALQNISVTAIAPPNGDIGIVETHRDERGFVVLLRTRGAPCATTRCLGAIARDRIGNIRRAIHGLCILTRREPNGRTHAAVMLDVLLVALILRSPLAHWRWLAVATAPVWFNTALERLCDHLHPDRHPAIGAAKDLAAGAVLVAAVFAMLIGASILLPSLSEALR